MPLHGLGVAAEQNEGGADTARRADGAEYIGRLGALIFRCPGPAPLTCPAAGDLVLLTDPRFVLPPEFYRGVGRQLGADFRHFGGEVF